MSRSHDVDRSFSWLGRFPLCIDLADTVREVGDDDVELLVDDRDLQRWVEAESPRIPSAEAAAGRLHETRELRDAVRTLLLAHAEGSVLPRREVQMINEASARSPSFPRLGDGGAAETVETSDDPWDAFAAEVARSTIEILTGDTDSIAVCAAPRCGMFFVRGNRRQKWCSPACGNRARVARHAARSKSRHRT